MGCMISGNGYRWPNRRIPFVIPDALTADQQRIIRGAIHKWDASTVMTFVERTNESDYIAFADGDDCSSAVGRQGGRQRVFCSFTGEGTVIHEIGHAVGLWHEQSRSDRDLFIIVHLENVQPGQLSQYDKHINDGIIFAPYDYSSVMHYSPNSRAIEWRPGDVIQGQLSKVNPTMAVEAFGWGIHMVHLDDSSNDIWWSIFDGLMWRKADRTPGNERIPGQRSSAAPALAEYNGRLYMVHLGDGSNDIYWSIFDGSRWNKPDGTPGNEPIPGQRSSAAPALAEHNGRLYMVHLGDGSNDIYNSVYDDTNGWQANKRTYNNQSNFTPSMATLGGNLYMVHNDGSNRIQQTIRDTSLRTIEAPAGVTFGLELELSDGDIQTVAMAYS